MFPTNEAHEQCFFSVLHGRKRYRVKLVRYLFNTFFLGRNNACMDIKKRQNVPFVIPIGS